MSIIYCTITHVVGLEINVSNIFSLIFNFASEAQKLSVMANMLRHDPELMALFAFLGRKIATSLFVNTMMNCSKEYK